MESRVVLDLDAHPVLLLERVQHGSTLFIEEHGERGVGAGVPAGSARREAACARAPDSSDALGAEPTGEKIRGCRATLLEFLPTLGKCKRPAEAIKQYKEGVEECVAISDELVET
jgi:hypothetical protein